MRREEEPLGEELRGSGEKGGGEIDVWNEVVD